MVIPVCLILILELRGDVLCSCGFGVFFCAVIFIIIVFMYKIFIKMIETEKKNKSSLNGGRISNQVLKQVSLCDELTFSGR